MSVTTSLATAPTLRPLGRSIGAVIGGVDLAKPLTHEIVRFVGDVVTEHQVVFIRGQRITAAQLHELAARFGALTVHPVDRVAGTPKGVTTISDTAARPPAEFDWHTDLSWTAEPPKWGFLHAVEIPATGGDTLWASGFAMYERLGRRLRCLCERRHADPCRPPVHDRLNRAHGGGSVSPIDTSAFNRGSGVVVRDPRSTARPVDS